MRIVSTQILLLGVIKFSIWTPKWGYTVAGLFGTLGKF